MNMSLSKLWEIVKDGESWHATFHGVTKSQTWLSDWTTTNNNNNNNYTNNTIGWDLQCARLWAHHVINSHNYFLRQGLVPSPFYSWRNWEPTKVINLLSLTGHVWMQELDCEESWAPKNWCFCTVVLEKTLESPTGCCFCFCSISSFFPELFLHCSSVVYWAPTDLGSSSFSVLYIAFSYCSWGSQGKNNEAGA